MAEIYGHKWTSAYGDKPVDTWVDGLRDIEPLEIAKGLEGCLLNGDGWPPSLPEFRQLCRPVKQSRINSEMYQEKPRALPEPVEMREKRKATGLAQLGAIKSIMGKK